MKYDPAIRLNPSALTSEQFLEEISTDRTSQIHAFVDDYIEESRKGTYKDSKSSLGWAMSTILSEVKEQFGKYAAQEAQRYILHDVCNLNVPLVSQTIGKLDEPLALAA